MTMIAMVPVTPPLNVVTREAKPVEIVLLGMYFSLCRASLISLNSQNQWECMTASFL